MLLCFDILAHTDPRCRAGLAMACMISAHIVQAVLVSAAQVETNKDRQLQRRVQSLQRFLMARLKAELAQRPPPQPPSPGDSSQTDRGGRGMVSSDQHIAPCVIAEITHMALRLGAVA